MPLVVAQNRGVFPHLPAYGCQQPVTFFENIGFDEGLPSLEIQAFLRDRRGFLWIGTSKNGLCRFDGQEMKVFSHDDADSTSIGSDDVASLLEDSGGNIWVGMGNGGIARMNPANGCCQDFTVKNGRHFSDHNNFIAQDPSGKIWVTCGAGFGGFDSTQQRFVQHPTGKIADSHRSAFDKNGKFWISGWKGLKCFDPKTDTLEIFLPCPDAPQSAEANATRVTLDRKDNIWVCTWGAGLFRFDPERRRFEQFRWKPKVNVPGFNNIACDIAETFDAAENRTFWIAMEYGLIKMPLAPNDFPRASTPFKIFADNPTAGIVSDFHNLLFADREGNLWVGSATHGVYRYNTRQANF